VFFLQNHDQVGNRAFGDRLHHAVDPAAWRAASVLFLVLPQTPLLFMGQEWAASAPFQYFTDHHAELGRLVREGRRREFARFEAFADPQVRERIPDPQAEATVAASRLDWAEAEREPHASVRRLYTDLLALRKSHPALGGARSVSTDIGVAGRHSIVVLRRARSRSDWLIVVCLAGPERVQLKGHRLAYRRDGRPWTAALTTENPSYTAHPEPVEIDARTQTLSFARAGAVVLRPADASGAGGLR
jgi:maltooligosyltrehalose trehalohydrolase